MHSQGHMRKVRIGPNKEITDCAHLLVLRASADMVFKGGAGAGSVTWKAGSDEGQVTSGSSQ